MPALAALGGGCAHDTANSPTGGWGLSLRMTETKGNKYLYYELERTGRLVYIAGARAKNADANAADPTWEGSLTRDEAAPIVAHLESDRKPVTTAAAEGGVVYNATLRAPGAWSTDATSGPAPFFERLRTLLDSVQRARRAKELGAQALGQ